jgi:hypothetical protein
LALIQATLNIATTPGSTSRQRPVESRQRRALGDTDGLELASTRQASLEAW